MLVQPLQLSGYQLGETLYEGTRTRVYRATCRTSDRPVIIKYLNNQYPTFHELVQFRNQYTICKNLPIPGIVRPLSLESLGNSYALVMEDVGGISLGQYIRQETLEILDVLAIGIQLTDILHDLSQHRVIHKDIKPANILINSETKQVKLIDFSIASLLPKETQEIQNPNVLEGTLAYIAPEQTGRMNRGIDYRSDFYALGVTLFELLAGQLPFESKDPMELVHSHVAKQPPSLTQFNIPEALDCIVNKLMAKNAESRYQSALGLKHDLEICLNQLRETGKIEAFEIGTTDRSDRFTIPEKLYGRETEVQALLDAFNRVAAGASELMLVAGFSGIGKTAVVNEIHKPITRQNGYFIKGKFDQFNRNIPLSAFVQALRDLMGQLLCESDNQLKKWKDQILEAVGENGQVLIEVIPELEQIIGQQEPAPELSGSAAQNRFNLLFQRFIEIFTTAEHPLVLFLDDLQWADLASLQLVKLLMNGSQNNSGYLLMLGAYRDNEVSPVHRFVLTVEEMKKAGAIANTITLLPLEFKDMNHLIADTLNCSTELAQPLTELINRKTQGNPFFTTQFLKALHEDGFIQFTPPYQGGATGGWQCDIAQIKALALTDDVVEFMAVQLQKLSDETQQVLKLAACVGNQFDLDTLAIISERSQIDTATALWKALQEGLILPTSQVYKFFQDADRTDTSGSANPNYRFLHDRVQQAAYSLIPDTAKSRTHLEIGQLLLNETAEAEQSEQLFAIVNHLNQGAELIQAETDRRYLIQLNLAAAVKAKAATAYSTTREYCQFAISFLPDDAWESDYKLMLSLHLEWAEAAYLCIDYDQCQEIGDRIKQKSTDIVDRAKVYELSIQIAMAQGNFVEAIDSGLSFLQQLGIELVDPATMPELQLPGFAELDRIPQLTDPRELAAMQILVALIPSSFTAQPQTWVRIILTLVARSLEFGHCFASSYGYIKYAMLLAVMQRQINAGFVAGDLGMHLLATQPNNPLVGKIQFVYNLFVRYLKEPAQLTITTLHATIVTSLEIGDVDIASACACYVCVVELFAGTPLDDLAERELDLLKLCQQLQQEFSIDGLRAFHQISLNLLGHELGEEPPSVATLEGASFCESTEIPRLKAIQSNFVLHLIYAGKTIVSYLMGDAVAALEFAVIANNYSGGVSITMPSIACIFYHSLSLLSLVSPTTDSQSLALDTATWEQVQQHQTMFAEWAAHAPMNFQHKYDLVEAEICRVKGDRAMAFELYDHAIAGAKENGYIQEEALANELAAKFYRTWGKEKVAAGYMQEAYYGYARWGAKAKTDDLETRYPDLLSPILQAAASSVNVFETLASISTPDRSIHTSTHASRTSSTSVNDVLDFATILKASQSLSGTIQLDELLQQLTQIILQHSGGDRCVLIRPDSAGEWCVEAIATPKTIALNSEPLDGNTNIPAKLIQYVKNTQEVLVIDNCQTNLPVIGQYLKQHQPKSVMGLPILNQAKLIGILCVENRSTSGVFTRDRILILNFLCTQAAISLENARLFASMQQAEALIQQKNQALEQALQEVQQSQLKLIQGEKMSALGNLVAGVAHEINNPVGCVVGNVGAAQDYINDLLGIIDLYQETFPQPGDKIIDELETVDLDYVREDLPKLIQAMKDGGERIKAISRSLRTFSRADTDTPQKFDLRDGIESTLLILRHRLKANEHRPAIDVIRDYAQLRAIDCFPGQLNQVFMNILANAIDMFDEMAQQSDYQALKDHPQTIAIQTLLIDPTTVEIRIRDNGKGMTEEVKAKIFDHLFTTKGVGKGTGLGMAIARQIVVEKHGGAIEVHSKVGRGTEFVITLPQG